MYVFYHDKNYYSLSSTLQPCLQKAQSEGRLLFYESEGDAQHALSSIKSMIESDKILWPITPDMNAIIDKLQVLSVYESPYHMERLENHGIILVEEEAVY